MPRSAADPHRRLPWPDAIAVRRRGRAEVLGGAALVIAGIALTLASSGAARHVLVYAPIAAGALAIVAGAVRLTPVTEEVLPPRPDVRRWIYGGLDAAVRARSTRIVIWKVIPNRLPSASLHLWTFPLLTLVMGVGHAASAGARGWWVAVLARLGRCCCR